MTSLGARRNAVRAEKGMGGPSLVEEYEALSWWRGLVASSEATGKPYSAIRGKLHVEHIDGAIRARIKAQPIGAWEGENPGLRYGVSDAERSYRRAAHPDAKDIAEWSPAELAAYLQENEL